MTIADVLDYSMFVLFCWVIAGVIAYEYTPNHFRKLLFRVHNLVSCILLTLVLASMLQPVSRSGGLALAGFCAITCLFVLVMPAPDPSDGG